jgi:CYTH domain-containing protein
MLNLSSPRYSTNQSCKEVWILTDYIEIERRFLVDGREEKPWRDGSLAYGIKQYYIPEGSLSLQEEVLLMDGIALVVPSEEEVGMWTKVDQWMARIRIRDGVYFLTCKSKMSHDSAYELEWVIDAEKGAVLLQDKAFPHVEKTRYVWNGPGGKAWEIDEFEGALAGLILAEIELERTEEVVTLPEWVGQEITGLSSWSNKSLANTLGS